MRRRVSEEQPQIERVVASAASPWTDQFGRIATRAAQFILIAIVAIGVVYASVTLKVLVIPVLIALIVACALRPVVDWLMRHRLPEALATVVTLLAGLLVFSGLVTLVVFGVRDQWDELVRSTTQGFDQLVGFLQEGPLPIDGNVLEQGRQAALDFAQTSQFSSGAIAGVTVAAEIVTGLVLGLVVLFFFLKDGPRIWAFLTKPFTGENAARARRIGHRGSRVLGGYVRGTAIVAAVDSLFIGIGLAVLGVPLVLPLSAIVFVGAFIPIVGATAAGIVAALVTLVTNGLTAAIVVTIIVIAVNQIEGNFLAPVVLGRSLKLHELVILSALTAGTILGGIVGTLISVPLAAVAWAIAKAWTEPADAPLDDPDAAPPARPRRRSRTA